MFGVALLEPPLLFYGGFCCVSREGSWPLRSPPSVVRDTFAFFADFQRLTVLAGIMEEGGFWLFCSNEFFLTILLAGSRIWDKLSTH